MSRWFYGSSFSIPQTLGWQPFFHYPANRAPGSHPQLLIPEPGRQPAGVTPAPRSSPRQRPASSPPRLWQGQGGTCSPVPHSPGDSCGVRTAQDSPGCLFSRLRVRQMRNRDCRPLGTPGFRKGSFSGNPFCKFPSTDDLRAALSELSKAGCRCRWWCVRRTVTPRFSKACDLQGRLILPFHSHSSPESIVPLPAFSSSIPILFIPLCLIQYPF